MVWKSVVIAALGLGDGGTGERAGHGGICGAWPSCVSIDWKAVLRERKADWNEGRRRCFG